MIADKKYPPVVVVDENDNEIGTAPLTEVWEKGLFHRIASVFILDETGHMLLQLRGPEVEIYPNRWDQAVGGHVDQGFNYLQTAGKETQEEIGLANLKFEELGTLRSRRKEGDQIYNQFERMYLAKISPDTKLIREADEVRQLKWFSDAELKQQIQAQPEKFTPGLLQGLNEFFPSYC